MIDRRGLLLASLAALLPATASAAWRLRQPTPQTFDYGPAKLDIYSRDNAGGLPVVFFIHGGAWRIGNRNNVNAKPGFLLDNVLSAEGNGACNQGLSVRQHALAA